MFRLIVPRFLGFFWFVCFSVCVVFAQTSFAATNDTVADNCYYVSENGIIVLVCPTPSPGQNCYAVTDPVTGVIGYVCY